VEQTQEACDRVKLYQLRPHGFPQPAKDRTMPEPATAYRFSFGPCNSSEGADSFGPDVRRGTLKAPRLTKSASFYRRGKS
jgi:hypothetical protein